MRESIAHTFLLNLIVIYIVIVFAVLFGAMSYYKAFKVNNMIISSIEKFEGYNSLSQDEINRKLKAIGYNEHTPSKCPDRGKDMILQTHGNVKYDVCVYYFDDEASKRAAPEEYRAYYNYSVTSFMSIDLPYIDIIKIPVNTKAERIYNFDNPEKRG